MKHFRGRREDIILLQEETVTGTIIEKNIYPVILRNKIIGDYISLTETTKFTFFYENTKFTLLYEESSISLFFISSAAAC